VTRVSKSIQLPIKISFLVSLIVFAVLQLFGESALLVVLCATYALVAILVLYWVVAQFSLRLRKSIWVSAIANAVIIYLGFLLISLSLFKNLLAEMKWNPSMAGLGIAIVAFGWLLFTQRKQPQTKETSEELRANVSVLSGKMDTLNEKFNKLENVLDKVLEKFQKLDKRLTKLQEEDTSTNKPAIQ